MGDSIFRACRERVSAQDAARHYGLTFDHKGWAVCPFHDDHHPSVSFRAGRFRCWSCGVSGDSIDFTGRLLGLEPMAAVERLNIDFGLDLPVSRQLTPKERLEAEKETRKRQELAETYCLFVKWRDGELQRLNTCFWLAHETLKGINSSADFDHLSERETLMIRWQMVFAYWADVLATGSIEAQMEIFRQREEIGKICSQVLNGLPRKSGVA